MLHTPARPAQAPSSAAGPRRGLSSSAGLEQMPGAVHRHPPHRESSWCWHDLTQRHKQGSQHQCRCDGLVDVRASPYNTSSSRGCVSQKVSRALHLFFLATASPRDCLLPSDLPGNGGEGMEPGSVAGRELFIPVPHQRVSAIDATVAVIAESGWVCKAGSAVDVPGFRQSSLRLSCACSMHGAVLQEERKTCNVKLYFEVLFWEDDSSVCSQTLTSFPSLLPAFLPDIQPFSPCNPRLITCIS